VKTSCPNCGAEVEFRYDDSFVRICGHCRSAVLRTDRGIESLGRVADLMPIDSPLRLFASGRYGAGTFLLVGVAQIRHAQGGMSQEWYGRFDAGGWGWLAEAQGRYYITFQQPPSELPPISAMRPGATVTLPVNGAPRVFTVAEANSASYVAASGELPFRLDIGAHYWFADLNEPGGWFATIDYGDGSERPTLYVGHQIALPDLHIHGGEAAPVARATIGSSKLACPNCNGSVEIKLPGETQSLVCQYCNHLLDTSSGQLSVLARLEQKLKPAIPLGATGKFSEGELTVIGYVQRSAFIDDQWWPFDEYLLHSQATGFRWLVASDGHWSYVQPIAPGAVTRDASQTSYDGVTFVPFQKAPLRVDHVVGEFYWKVEIGELVYSEDLIAPPTMLSREATKTEENWSLSTYLEPHDVQRAFGTKLDLPRPKGYGANQLNTLTDTSKAMMLGVLALIVAGIVFAVAATRTKTFTYTATITDQPQLEATTPAIDPATGQLTAPVKQPSNVSFSEPFKLAAGKNIELEFAASGLENNWAYVAVDLVNEETGQVVTVDGSMESYSGIDDGEAWSEGDRTTRVNIGPQPAGTYVLRVEGQHGGRGDVLVAATVRQDVFRLKYLLWALGVMGTPLLLVSWVSWSREKTRWENSHTGKPPVTLSVLPLLAIGGAFALIGAVIKAVFSRDDD
jgi:hypothetical protein